jgi:DNA-binding response OmpR family regulator
MKTILIIEGDEFLRAILYDFLLLQGFNIVVAENGGLGLHFATELYPTLIICDVNLPDIDGYNILRQLKANFKTSNIPFILMTSETDSNNRAYAFELGANDYLVKPFQFKDFMKVIEAQFKNPPFASSSFSTDTFNSNQLPPCRDLYDSLKPDNGKLIVDIQQFSQQMNSIFHLENNGKLSPEEAYEQIRIIWQQLH